MGHLETSSSHIEAHIDLRDSDGDERIDGGDWGGVKTGRGTAGGPPPAPGRLFENRMGGWKIFGTMSVVPGEQQKGGDDALASHQSAFDRLDGCDG
jgi:hypothetical protein